MSPKHFSFWKIEVGKTKMLFFKLIFFSMSMARTEDQRSDSVSVRKKRQGVGKEGNTKR